MCERVCPDTVSRFTRRRTHPPTLAAVSPGQLVLFHGFSQDRAKARLLLSRWQEDVMQMMVEVTTALTGVALGVIAGRLCLEGILTVAFRKPPQVKT